MSEDNPLINTKENPFVSIAINILIPAFVLFYLSNDEYLGSKLGFVVALSFPFFYGVYDFMQRRKVNFIAALGLINVLLTGGIGLLEIDNHWLAVKEATIPALIGLAVLASVKTKYPLVKTLFYNDLIVDTAKVEQALETRENKGAFDKLVVRSTMILSSSFLVSSVLNYILAKMIVVSAPGSAEYNQELGKLTLMSYPVIVIPSMIVMGFAFWYLYKGIKNLTALDAESIFKTS
ncbi:MAG: MFS transporter [uncultured Thiotrichaceae bacterium]|uniref:MFS transporter n=1 Tax=uncultured Thiotrichaceae bacterium TaxID=298394 RepID=A0A6S6SFD9_9GAMM|nr:MAG: MFS transporter [uncultured Thiotrichaceae bacterium]